VSFASRKCVKDNMRDVSANRGNAMLSQVRLHDPAAALSKRSHRQIRLTRSAAVLAGIAALTLTAAGAAQAQDAPSWTTQVIMAAGQKIRIVPTPGLTFPWSVAFLPNGDQLISEKYKNTLRVIHNGTLDPTPITGIPPVLQGTQGDRGGVDVIVHPQYAQNKWIYIAYHQPMPGKPNVARPVLVRAHYDQASHTLTDLKDIFVSDAWNDAAVATRITFGQDGKIYMVIGTAFVNAYGNPPSEYGNNLDAQNPMKDAGKVLRFNDDGSIPRDNPFVGNAKYKPEIYALGIRNAMGLYSEPGTGKFWLTDNGPRGGDEINVIKPGLNYGWPLVTYGRAYTFDAAGKRSGNNVPISEQPPSVAPGMEPPFLFWVPSPSVTGITIYNGDKFPAWKNSILVGALRGKRLERISFTSQGFENDRAPMLENYGHRIRDLKQGPDGDIYLVTDDRDGAMLRIEPADAATPLTSR
jgi:glucose/arabinose dehydrogenase